MAKKEKQNEGAPVAEGGDSVVSEDAQGQGKTPEGAKVPEGAQGQGKSSDDGKGQGKSSDDGKGQGTAAAPSGSKDDASSPLKPADPDWKTLYALTLADFDNYKKRAARDREDTYRFAEADILKDVLPSIDNLALALANAKQEDDPFVKGVQLVYDALLKSFKDHGAEPFDSLGQELDPEKMEAIATLPSPDYEEGKVSTEVKRGWMLKDKLLRAAQVVVSSGKPPAPPAEPTVADQSDSGKQP